MKIVYVAAGAAGMICGSCIRDVTLVRALRAAGHDAVLVPLYTPLRTDEGSVEAERVFYGAINIYLEEKSALWRRIPRRLVKWLDSPAILKLLRTSNAATDASSLGGLTLSMLRGEHGDQSRELDELVRWLAKEVRPDVLQITNSMLMGIAHRIRDALPGVPIVCALQGEDIFLEDLRDPWKEQVLREMRARCRDIDLFVSTSMWYADRMAELLSVPREKIHTAPLGIATDGHQNVEAEGPPWVVGYIARICPEKGLHHAAQAFRLLSRRFGAGQVRFEIAGYLGGRDHAYLDEQTALIEEWGLSEHVVVHGEIDHQAKLDMLDRLHVLTVPTVYQEPKGLPVLEAMASGVPVVQPAHGAFPEMIEATGGGVLVEPGDPEALAVGIEMLLRDPERRRQLGSQGRTSVLERYSDKAMAASTIAAYEAAIAAVAAENRS